MIIVDNRSGFPAELLIQPNLDGQEIALLLVSSTWIHGRDGNWIAADEPEPIPFADSYYGDPPSYASVANESQTAWAKPLIDVVVNGSAHAPGGRPASSLVLGLYVGTIAKQIRVVGDRYQTLAGPSWPEKFVSMPLVYERAYGGADLSSEDPGRHSVWRWNPAGVGYRGSRSRSAAIATEYPNLEPMGAPLDGLPAGFGIISRGWSPRLEFAGSFDEQWLQEQWPLLPLDFDIRHNQAAPNDQQLVRLDTGDPVRLVNFTPEGLWDFAMPQTTMEVCLLYDRDRQKITPRMDTVLIAPEQRKVTMIFRTNLTACQRTGRIRSVVIGPVSEGYLRATLKRKVYLDFKRP